MTLHDAVSTNAPKPERPPLVLIAGMNLSDRLWSKCNFPEDTVTVVPSGRSMDVNVHDMLETLPQRFYLGGLSLGAIMAMRLATTEPERVAGLLLMSTNAKAPTETQKLAWSKTLVDIDNGKSPEQFQADILTQLLSDDACAEPGIVDETLQCAADLSADVLRAQLTTQLTRHDERPSLAQLRIPTVVLAGSEDAMCPLSNHEEIAALIAGSTLLVSEGAGHLVPLEEPGEVDAAVDTLFSLAGRPP